MKLRLSIIIKRRKYISFNQIFNESIIVWKVLPVVIVCSFIHYLYLYLLAHQISTILNGGQIVKKRSVVTARIRLEHRDATTFRSPFRYNYYTIPNVTQRNV